MITFAQNLPTTLRRLSQIPALIDFRSLISPASATEAELLGLNEFHIGLNWGAPRFGHPEGKVGFHIVEVLKNIEKLEADESTYRRLRLTALAHDTFKHKEEEAKKMGKRINHGLLSRRFMEGHIDDEATLDLIELHDEIYYSWRHGALESDYKKSDKRLGNLLTRIGEQHMKLHYLFFRCDTMTGDKIQTPRIWFERKIKEMGCSEMTVLVDRLNSPKK